MQCRIIFLFLPLFGRIETVYAQKQTVSSSSLPGGITVQVFQYQYQNGSTVSNINNINGGGGSSTPINGSTSSGTSPQVSAKSSLEAKYLFGASFCPYGPADNILPEIGNMLKVIKTKVNSIGTNMLIGKVAGKAKCQIACTAAQLNKLAKSTQLKVVQGTRVFRNKGAQKIPQSDIENALNAAQSANRIWPETVWALSFNVDNDWGFIQDVKDVSQVTSALKQGYANKARDLGLKVGTKLDICSEMVDGVNKNDMIDLVKTVDYAICFVYPPAETESPEAGVASIDTIYQRYRKAFVGANPKVEVIIETGWASEGESDFNPEYLNTPEKQEEFWDKMRQWSVNNQVQVIMYEAFDQQNSKSEFYRHMGFWQKSKNGGDAYIEKFSGKVVAP